MTQNDTTEPRWPLAGSVTVKGADNTKWYFDEPSIGLDDRPLSWLKNHPSGNLHDELVEQAKDHGLREKLYFRADESGLVTDTSKIDT